MFNLVQFCILYGIRKLFLDDEFRVRKVVVFFKVFYNVLYNFERIKLLYYG